MILRHDLLRLRHHGQKIEHANLVGLKDHHRRGEHPPADLLRHAGADGRVLKTLEYPVRPAGVAPMLGCRLVGHAYALPGLN